LDLEQLLPARPAEDCSTAVLGSAGRAIARSCVFAELQLAFHFGELSVYLLKLGRETHQHVKPEVISRSHLIRDSTKIPLALCELTRKLSAPAVEAVNVGPRSWRRSSRLHRSRRCSHNSRAARAWKQFVDQAHDQLPVDIKPLSSLDFSLYASPEELESDFVTAEFFA